MVQVLGDYIDNILEDATLENVHMFMHQFFELFGATYVRETWRDPKNVQPKFFSLTTMLPTPRWQVGSKAENCSECLE